MNVKQHSDLEDCINFYFFFQVSGSVLEGKATSLYVCIAFNNNNTNLSLIIISIIIITTLKGAGGMILKKREENGLINYSKVTRVKVSQEIQNFLLKEIQDN